MILSEEYEEVSPLTFPFAVLCFDVAFECLLVLLGHDVVSEELSERGREAAECVAGPAVGGVLHHVVQDILTPVTRQRLRP